MHCEVLITFLRQGMNLGIFEFFPLKNCNFIETIMTYILSKRQIVINIKIIANKKLTQKNVIFILAHYWY